MTPSESQHSKVAQLRMDPAARRRSGGTFWTILIVVSLVAVGALMVWRPWQPETSRVVSADGSTQTRRPAGKSAATATTRESSAPAASSASSTPAPAPDLTARDRDPVVLTVSGYIINRERIELSPRFMGQVRWIDVKKGDFVTNGQIVVRLDDAEYQAQKRELEGRRDAAMVQLRRAELELRRTEELAEANIETQRVLDLARLDVEAAKAELKALEGQLARVNTYIDWTVIRSPIDGVVLEKLVDPNELVTPQSFGGTRGPSTALISLGDPKDLQVEIDLNEADLAKVYLGQRCRVSPEAYLDRSYEGVVAEVAPEASRQKGTLQVKVQIRDPDRYLVPELSAKVDFLAEPGEANTASR